MSKIIKLQMLEKEVHDGISVVRLNHPWLSTPDISVKWAQAGSAAAIPSTGPKAMTATAS